MGLMDKLLKAGSVKGAEILSESTFFSSKDSIPTHIPIINVALSGSLSGGLESGLTMLAGPSRHFKSNLGLVMIKAYLDQYSDAVCLFMDSEFGITKEYIASNGIDPARVLHIPIEHVEQLKFDLTKRLEAIERGDKVIIFIDSIGNLASKKEVDDAIDEKSVADMSRAKSIKSLFRIITPHLTTKNIPCIAVNHTYQEMCLAGDTRIKTENGLKPISEIKVGEMVYAKNGLQPVSAIMGPNELSGDGKVFLEIEFDDGSSVRCTHDHKFLTKENKWVAAMYLPIGQEMR